MPQQFAKRVDTGTVADPPGWYAIEHTTNRTFPPRKQVTQTADDDVAHRRPLTQGSHVAEVCIGTHDDLGLGVLHEKNELTGGVNRRYRNGHGTQVLEPEVCDDPLRTIGQVEQNAVPRPNPQPPDSSGESLHQFAKFVVAKLSSEKPEGYLVGVALTALLEGTENRPFFPNGVVRIGSHVPK